MIRYYLSKQDAATQLVEQAPLLGYQGTGGLPSLYINPAKTFQTLEGFGGAFTASAATTWKKLPLAQQQEVLKDLEVKEAELDDRIAAHNEVRLAIMTLHPK